ncbi:helix-turn-helix domain-containing protein [Sporolactobacillus sp. CQH2019]|uniref:winged helix-turn-helix transcriptional regulator n=1 Tax=Sporolactobacillus sp. CQH2019 TaxID=3023512 RepID=UPI002368ABA5|nr:helix-turn-helix domain-containing protein [Sporolactobacillus sp. CQH2019]MDD9147915.1 helix-turn-helix domain-containing protein [Sporolactobacillus sp. CQH2019]
MSKDFSETDKNKRQRDFQCSIGFSITVIGSKWRAIILWHILKSQPIRYGQLKKSIPNISHKVLSEELHHLKMDGLIERIAYATIPPKVEYIPTPRGKSLKNILRELCNWGKEYF